MRVIAFHGAKATPEMLRRDMGDPSWVTHYHSGKSLADAIECIGRRWEPCVLVGYSRGGEMIAELASCIRYIIAGAVVYESPVNPATVEVPGEFPVLQVWNDYRPRRLLRRLRKEHAIRAWAANHRVTHLTGRFTSHIQRYPDGSYGHAWDTGLNDYIHRWIEELSSRIAV